MGGAAVCQADGDRYWRVPGSASLNMSPGVTWWSVFWRGVNPVVMSRRIIAGGGASDTWSIEATSINRIRLRVFNTAGNEFTTALPSALQIMQWSHFFCYVDWTTGILSQSINNGTPLTVAVTGSPRLNDVVDLHLGRDPWGGSAVFPVSAMQVMMGRDPVTPLADICTALYTTGPSALVPDWNTIHHWPMGTDPTDQIGSDDFVPENNPSIEILTTTPSNLYESMLYHNIGSGGGASGFSLSRLVNMGG